MATPRPTGALALEIRTYLAAASAQRQALCSTDTRQGTLRGACVEAPVSPTLAIGDGEGTPGVCGPPKPSITLGGAVTTGRKAEGSEDPGTDGRFWSAAPSLCRVSFLQEVPGAQWWSGPRPTLARALSIRGQRRLRPWAPPSCAVAERVPWRWQTALDRGGEEVPRSGCGAGGCCGSGRWGVGGGGVATLRTPLTRGRRDRSRRRALTTAPCS